MRADVLIHPIGELATPVAEGGPLHGQAMSRVERVAQAAVAIAQDKIVAAGGAGEVLSSVETDSSTIVVSAAGKLVTPGLVDPHTHLIFAGNRANEFVMRCQGKTYQEIARAGGGITASVTATRQADLAALVESGLSRLGRMLAAGTTTCEVKTGYGLDLASELRMLETIGVLAEQQPVELVPTFMPAHAVPPGIERQRYVDEVVSDMLPAAVELSLSGALGRLPLPFNDVFCDEGYFTVEDTRRILEAGLRLGMKAKVHADEFANLGATRLAVELGAVSADHLLSVSHREIDLLAGSNTVAVLLPGTSFYLNLSEHAPARRMIDKGVAVALGSDFNPGSCHIFSLPLIWGLACLHLKMTPEEALT
ncbi:MAG TPA: imidazolonepropionase, partial [Candidatus Obscuribacterales bacterium]